MRGAVDALDEVLAVFCAERDAGGTIIRLRVEEHNAAAAKLFGRAPKRLTGRDLAELSPETVRCGLWAALAGAIDAAGDVQLRVDVQGSGRRWWEVSARALGEDRVGALGRDVTEAVRAEHLLESAYDETAAARATLQTALDATSDCFAVYDVELGEDLTPTGLLLRMINAAGAAPIGSVDDLIGVDLRDFYPQAVESGLWGAVCGAIVAQQPVTFRLHEYDPAGSLQASWDNTIAPVSTDQVVLTWRDVTKDERRQRQLALAHDEARHAANHDPLTGLANRVLFEEKLEEVLWNAGTGTGTGAGSEERVAIVFCDLDGFKEINDSLGHAAGDDVLRVIGSRLVQTLRGSDIVARIGGDEFLVLVRYLPLDWDQAAFLARLRRAVEQPVQVAGRRVQPGLSLGMAVSPPDTRDLTALVQQADERMYDDKVARRAARDGHREQLTLP
jgi:diguanylate cyclase (GGDEF)-like protein